MVKDPRLDSSACTSEFAPLKRTAQVFARSAPVQLSSGHQHERVSLLFVASQFFAIIAASARYEIGFDAWSSYADAGSCASGFITATCQPEVNHEETRDRWSRHSAGGWSRRDSVGRR